jgi:hypothetical protein
MDDPDFEETDAEFDEWAKNVAPWRIVRLARAYMIARYRMLREASFGPHFDAMTPLLQVEGAMWNALSGTEEENPTDGLIDGARRLGIRLADRDAPKKQRRTEPKPKRSRERL